MKEEQINTVESEINQLKHQLQLAQESQKALLEAADEREREYEQAKNKLQDGSLTQGKFVHLSLQLKSEKQKAQQLEENCKRLQEIIDEGQLTMSSLQKQLDGINKNRDGEISRLESEVTALNDEIKSVDAELKQAKENISREESRVKELAVENENLQDTLKEFQSLAQRERVHSSETKEECNVLKEQLNGMMSAKSEAEMEKEELIVSESKEKVKLREIERQMEEFRDKLEAEKQLKEELEEKVQKLKAELKEKMETLDAISKEKLKLQEQIESLETQGKKAAKENEELAKLFKELETIYYKKEQELTEANKKLKKVEEELERLCKNHEEEVEFLKVQLLLAEEKCSNLRRELEEAQEKSDSTTEVRKLKTRLHELEACYDKSKASVVKLDGELCHFRCKVTELEDENKSLSLRLNTKPRDESVDNTTSRELQEKIQSLEENLSKEKIRADEEAKKFQQMVDEYHAFIKKYKNLERQNTSLQRRLQFATEKLKKKSQPADDGGSAPDEALPEVTSPKVKQTATVISTNTASMLSPLARSMSSLGITTASSTVTTDVCTEKQQPVRSLLPPKPIVQESALPVRAEQSSRPGSKLSKRVAERGMCCRKQTGCCC